MMYNLQINEFQETIKYLGLEMEAIMMYQTFYYQHKQKHGSYKVYIANKDGEYIKKMQEREDWIGCMINETIESKLDYEKKKELRKYEEYIDTLK